MSEITVTVRGPGGVINMEVEVIRLALEGIGCKVEVINDAPFKEGYIGNKKSTLDEIVADYVANQRRNTSVLLVADHCPWGG